MLYRDLQDLFFKWPVDPKPPIDSFPILNQSNISNVTNAANSFAKSKNQIIGREIQIALAGFTESDVKVWNQDNVLHIEGDSTYNDDISSKFRCKFHYEIPCIKELDLEGAHVFFKDGLLRIQLLIKEKQHNKNYLFGK